MRWVVGPDDGRQVRHILASAGADADAVRDGRVFVGRRRVRDDRELVRSGDVVEIAPKRAAAVQGPRVIATTRDLVAVDKPAGVPTIADHTGSAHSLLRLVARSMGVAESALHPTSRLDRDVSGVVVFALTPQAARRLARARSAGRYERRYVAVAAGAPEPDRGTWDAPIGRAADPRLRAVGGREPIAASTRYRVCARASGGTALLAVEPVTGRTHQIRVHAAHAGAALLGDRAYGGSSRLVLPGGRVLDLRRIALHAARVVVPQDDSGAAVRARAPIPSDLAGIWSALGGQPDAWELAETCAVQ
ncbi:MAG TPA: pseudouridine synthase [Polyangiaceae bacterium]|nr:pseudouridine synthase [Polyangiaceae bacterium]